MSSRSRYNRVTCSIGEQGIMFTGGAKLRSCSAVNVVTKQSKERAILYPAQGSGEADGFLDRKVLDLYSFGIRSSS